MRQPTGPRVEPRVRAPGTVAVMRWWLPILALAFWACHPGLNADQYPEPESLYKAAMAEYRLGHFDRARTGFQRLTFEFSSRDPRQAEARYYLGECMLHAGEQLEAAIQFRRVADEFPNHPLAPDALLRAGDAYAELWRNPALDPNYGETATATYRELLARYPATPAAARAQQRIGAMNEMFAEKDYQNGVFYLRVHAYDSAIIYFRDVVAQYGQSTYAPKAVVRLVEVYGRLGYDDERSDMCNYLRQYYPNDVSAAEACATGGG